MANSQNNTSPSRFDNFSDGALADEIGRVDSIFKAAEAELKALKDEFKARGLSAVTGDAFSVTATEQIAGRLDAKAVRDYLGAAYSRFEVAVVSTVIRIKAANRTLNPSLQSRAPRASAGGVQSNSRNATMPNATVRANTQALPEETNRRAVLGA